MLGSVMDPVNLGFYAIICGVLAAVGPALGGLTTRIIAGATVGLVAASALPYLKQALGLG